MNRRYFISAVSAAALGLYNSIHAEEPVYEITLESLPRVQRPKDESRVNIAAPPADSPCGKAIYSALDWLAEHQLPDGSWNYNHQLAPSCRGKCENPGSMDKTRNAATGMALLPFLYAGQTHWEGKYKENLIKGLDFLSKAGNVRSDGCIAFSESGGTIYSHGICAMALCVAYGLTKDKRLFPVAQGSINYIAFHQDPAWGGWRYSIHQAGDTSASGWQIIAIKAGKMAGLHYPAKSMSDAERFFDSVQTENGAKYGYIEPGDGVSTTAIGLLCRQAMGWDANKPAMIKGLDWIKEKGPSKSDSYFNFYASTLINTVDAEKAKQWNNVIEKQLLDLQCQQGHEKGSWFASGPWSPRGGRLFDTALSAMILESIVVLPKQD